MHLNCVILATLCFLLPLLHAYSFLIDPQWCLVYVKKVPTTLILVWMWRCNVHVLVWIVHMLCQLSVQRVSCCVDLVSIPILIHHTLEMMVLLFEASVMFLITRQNSQIALQILPSAGLVQSCTTICHTHLLCNWIMKHFNFLVAQRGIQFQPSSV